MDFDEATVLDEDTAFFNFTFKHTSDPAGTLQATADGGTVQITLADGRGDAGETQLKSQQVKLLELYVGKISKKAKHHFGSHWPRPMFGKLTLPSPNETPICEDLSLNPNSISIEEGEK